MPRACGGPPVGPTGTCLHCRLARSSLRSVVARLVRSALLHTACSLTQPVRRSAPSSCSFIVASSFVTSLGRRSASPPLSSATTHLCRLCLADLRSAQPSHGACLHGSWRLDPQRMRGIYHHACAPAWRPEAVPLLHARAQGLSPWTPTGASMRLRSARSLAVPSARLPACLGACTASHGACMTARGYILSAYMAHPCGHACRPAEGWILGACEASVARAHPHGSRRLYPQCLHSPPLRTCLQGSRRLDPRCMRGLCCAHSWAWQPEVVSSVPA